LFTAETQRWAAACFALSVWIVGVALGWALGDAPLRGEASGRVVLAPGAIVAIIEDFRVVLAAWWTFRHLIRLRRVG
jgi:hypothetical protein